jgi:hypothetical protein
MDIFALPLLEPIPPQRCYEEGDPGVLERSKRVRLASPNEKENTRV